ncbi:hypothetical protein CCO03_11510 [Comamonas serinivorans]|uniref:Bacterial repeat domain-containing protein n=1 Tax=Comamonas serinivorans TaxID=1082851 RepID=A0A1Y0ENL8_9BURK|nr:hypothetical protein CCO03_11510 [Comamonas serinivorans]
MTAASAQAAVCRVSPTGTAGNDGALWTTPKNLASALATASCTEVWLAPGTYTGGLVINRNLVLRGGFAGTEAAASDRVTPIDPGLAVLDGGGAQRVLTLDGTTAGGSITADTVIEGLTIQNGSNLTGFGWGGGAYCNASLFNVNRSCSPRIQRVRFLNNTARYGGALMLDAGTNARGTASPQLTDVVFDGNTATAVGGAVYSYANVDGQAHPVITGATFSNNRAPNGGAIYNSSGSAGAPQASPVITNATFVNNATTGTGVNGGGAIYNQGNAGTNAMRLTNVTFTGNAALGLNHMGGAIYNQGSNARPIVTNAIFWDNQASNAATQDILGGAAQISHSIVQSGCPASATCASVLTGDPLLGPLADNGGLGQTRMPGLAGAAIDVGDAGLCPAVDQRGALRPQGAGCDLGAVELPQAPRQVLSVAVTGEGTVSDAASAIACTASGGTCNASYTSAVGVSLSAVAAAGHHFSGWGGDCSGTGPCSLTMDVNRSVTALFEVNRYTVTPAAGAGGSLSCQAASVDHGASLSCTAVPAPGHTTALISGCGGTPSGAGENAYTTGPITEACTVTAQFLANSYPVVASVSPAEGGTLLCPASVSHGDSASCTATANTGYRLVGFTGCDAVNEHTCTLSPVTGPRSVVATYAVVAPTPVPVPALGPWALAMLTVLAGAVGLRRARRKG